MSGPRRLNLSGAQVIASVLATLTAAVAASYLGVAGTLVGAAVGSLVSTMGTEIYKHYLQRSEERLRSAGQVLYHSAARTRTGNTMAGAEGATSGGRPAAQSGAAGPDGRTRDLADAETAVWDHRQYGASGDPNETRAIQGPGTQGRGASNGGVANSRTDGRPANGSLNGGPSSGGNAGGSAGGHAHGSITAEGADGDAAGHGGVWAAITSFFGSLTRRQWLTYGSMAGAFFLIVVAGITVFQLTTGKQVGSVVYGHHASGAGHTSSPTPTAHPSSTSSATPTGSASTSPTPSAGSSSPTPGTSVTPSSPSTVPSPTPSTGSTAARSSAKATPTP